MTNPTEQTQTERPPGITCPKYVRGEGKRCRHYVATGGCTLPDETICIEWAKANPRASASPAPEPARDLFGNAVPPAPPGPRKDAAAQAAGPRAPLPEPTPIDVKQVRGLRAEDIDSFRALGVEVCFESERYGEIWLVPAYTGQARREITPENLATLVCVALVFPGAHAVRIDQRERPAAQATSAVARKESPA